jgi:hypothetical protein
VFPLSRSLTLTAAGIFVALTTTISPAPAEEAPNHKPIVIDQADVDSQLTECHLQRRAISRRACQARLSREMIAENE